MFHIKETIEIEIEIKKSKFIGILSPVDSEDKAREFLAMTKKKHPNATHYCTALIIGNTQRSNDDGEPSGTAGLPMLECLRHKDLDNVIAIVVRYFGGTLLGTGGLVRAYQQATNEAINKATLTTPIEMKQYIVTVPYNLNSKIETLLRKKADILDIQYEEEVTYTFLSIEDLTNQFSAISSGTITPTFIDTVTVEK